MAIYGIDLKGSSGKYFLTVSKTHHSLQSPACSCVSMEDLTIQRFTFFEMNCRWPDSEPARPIATRPT